MKDSTLLTGSLAMTFGLLHLTPEPAAADRDAHFAKRWDEQPVVCELSADRMLKACLFGLGESQHTTLANCLNIADAGERESCTAEAQDARSEELGTCFAVHEARRDACELLGEDRYTDPLESDTSFIDPNEIPATYAPNPFVSLAAGHTYVLSAGEEGEETVIVHVTEETREILGTACRIVKDVVFEEDEGEHELVEYTDDWFAQDAGGNVYYCGEISRNYEDGILRNVGGSFEAGVDFAKAGSLIRRFPAAGEAHRQEYALGEAEDIAKYEADGTFPGPEEGGENTNAPEFECRANSGCLKVMEFTPLEPEASEFKYYRENVGFVLAVALEDGEFADEREKLVCVGDSLGVLDSCVLDDEAGTSVAEAVGEQLCALDPAAFSALCDE